jgi:hypothetical protein
MAHKLNKTNQDWKDAVDQGIVLSLDQGEVTLVDFKFWKRSDKSEPVRCSTSMRGGRDTRAALGSTGELSKHGKEYACVVTTDVCMPEQAGTVRNGTRHDPPVTINLTKFGPQTAVRHSTTLMSTR